MTAMHEALICKHCRTEVLPAGDGSHRHRRTNKNTCEVEPYGFHAEPIGTSCGDHPANSCLGASGAVPLRGQSFT
ncbi:hypothetical protein SEA_GENECOCO_70 [Mycobacterium phage GeneCoco]|nr:hypothetical protein PIGLET_0070 [Mycobacterium phage Piglet]AKF12359.1 putative HNH protein [Mycobacterium phage PDRPv]AKF12464.1 putative HNH protein [Mycobacterium phage PDRPxv]ANT41934.1 hypothetical protein PBI_PHATCATS2014_70 [Mycobacterium phage PhatCats2014]AOQ29324.1 hypothetical protein SEA_PINKMAN_69 [Mycobacterium phage Pinkman]AVJ50183.1 hypothetical protein SEA_MEGATRON_70 [Mycobacterium phage Megatron]AXC38437.1 hypothetical protein SEA_PHRODOBAGGINS_71 [Mycobacterium phage 